MTRDQKIAAFVIMPISDMEGYDPGHFGRVYKYLIGPACEVAGFNALRADEVKNTNYIVLDIIRRIIEAPIAVCDLSARNPNVLYELGIRQAFNLPVVLIKDSRSERVFDIQGFRTLDYDESLRVDSIETDKMKLADAIKATIAEKADVNSLVQLLGIKEAQITATTEISPEIEVILDSLRDLSRRMTGIEDAVTKPGSAMNRRQLRAHIFTLPNGDLAIMGQKIFDSESGHLVGYLEGVSGGEVHTLDAPEGQVGTIHGILNSLRLTTNNPK